MNHFLAQTQWPGGPSLQVKSNTTSATPELKQEYFICKNQIHLLIRLPH